MPLPSILKKASTYILGVQTGTPSPPPFTDGEIIFCKNNVCVHPPTLLRQACDIVHHPGYLTIICQQQQQSQQQQHGDANTSPRPTLQLSWIPNTTLRRNPWTIEKTCPLFSYSSRSEDQEVTPIATIPHRENNCEDSRLAPDYQRQSSADSSSSSCSNMLVQHSHESKPDPSPGQISPSEQQEDPVTSSSHCSEKSRCQHTEQKSHTTTVCTSEITSNSDSRCRSTCSGQQPKTRPHSLECKRRWSSQESSLLEVPEVDSEQNNGTVVSPVISIEESQEDDTATIHTVSQISRSPSLTSTCSLSIPPIGAGTGGDEIPPWMSSPELLALQHNLTFPESATASPIVRRTHRCRRFSVDLSQMRSLRLFFNDSACTCGQLVVASRESQYKILHFHHGGLDRLATVLQEWNFLLHSPQPRATDQTQLPYRHFMGIFFGGLERSMRRIVWPFLLHCFTFQSTYEEREQILEIRHQEYHEITRRRLEMEPEQQQNFWRNVQCIVEKDVVRTDRGNPYFAGEDNPNIDVMKNILLNYAVYNPGFGYTQGMSDLLAPVLAEIQNESDAFWCFVGLMQKAIFVCTPTDNDMDKNLSYLRELIRLMVPHFYAHLESHADAMELLFCHRWILLCFKREFPEAQALRMWEACWANYLTDYFHLFLCLAIISIYSDDVIAQDLRTDEMLLHFSSLAMFMDGELILRKARGLLHQFRQMPRIPCTLGSLCQLCGPGMWDSTHAPVVECSGHHTDGELCPHRGLQHQ
ncbi:TBC1 domain family member 16 isoform X2 [Periplaneta americana]|uniref:TBC1 domain family member 16 isoform X2 n=1 Tax=Periplaneta americana TaxID=6978 RepID=UPI0037E88889